MDAQGIVARLKEHFNPDVYLQQYYGCDISTIHPFMKARIDILSEFFASGTVVGKRLLDVGTGPSIASVIAASRHFDEIYLSDILQPNLDFLNEWWKGKISPLDYVINYCLDIEESSQTVAERTKEIRDKVNGIFSIDVQKSNPLMPNRLAVFDAIVSTGCLDSASSSPNDYRIAVSNVASLLKKNGKLVISGALELSNYTVGDVTFQLPALSEKDICEIYAENGFEVEVLKLFNSTKSDVSSAFGMIAKKVIG